MTDSTEFSFVTIRRSFPPRAIRVVEREKVAVLDLERSLDGVRFRFSTKRRQPRTFRIKSSLRIDKVSQWFRFDWTTYGDSESGIDATE